MDNEVENMEVKQRQIIWSFFNSLPVRMRDAKIMQFFSAIYCKDKRAD